jgi:hypothetical protein
MELYAACAADANILHPLHRLQDYFELFSVALRHNTVIYHAYQDEACYHIGHRLLGSILIAYFEP